MHIMGSAWRWMIARGFNLPLVLDELDVLLDSKNFERTKRLIQEEMDRQTIILTLKEDLRVIYLEKATKLCKKEEFQPSQNTKNNFYLWIGKIYQ